MHESYTCAFVTYANDTHVKHILICQNHHFRMLIEYVGQFYVHLDFVDVFFTNLLKILEE